MVARVTAGHRGWGSGMEGAGDGAQENEEASVKEGTGEGRHGPPRRRIRPRGENTSLYPAHGPLPFPDKARACLGAAGVSGSWLVQPSLGGARSCLGWPVIFQQASLGLLWGRSSREEVAVARPLAAQAPGILLAKVRHRPTPLKGWRPERHLLMDRAAKSHCSGKPHCKGWGPGGGGREKD